MSARPRTAMADAATRDEGDYLDYQDLTLPLDPKLIFEAPPQHFQAVVYVKRQHELLDAAIHGWIHKARECQSVDSPKALQEQIAFLAKWAARGADGSILEVRGNNWTHQQRLMQALYSIGPELQDSPPATLSVLMEFLGPMVLDPVQECCSTIEKFMKTAKLYCRQTVKLFENSINAYHAMPGKQPPEGSRETQLAKTVVDTKKEMCKAMYALSGTLNHAIAYKESFILEKTDLFLSTLRAWRSLGLTSPESLKSTFAGPMAETIYFREDMFPPVRFPQDSFKDHFIRFCQSLRQPVTLRDLQSLDDEIPTPGQKSGYLFQRSRRGEWTRQYFYILPNGMLMQFSKGRDIQIANLRQTLLRPVNVDSRDFAFEICSIEIYLTESILQAATKIEFEEWKAAIFHWHPPDDDIPPIETLKVSTPPTRHIFPRPRQTSTGRAPDGTPSSPKPRVSTEIPVVLRGDLFILDVRSKPTHSQNRVISWKRIHCCIRTNGHFAQFNIGEKEKPFETIPLADTLRTHIWALDGSLFSRKHCFSIRSAHDVNYYTVSIQRSPTDQEAFNTWMYALKSYAKPEMYGVNELSEYRVYRTFWIIVNDARSLPRDMDTYCEIMLDDQRRARTSMRLKAKASEPDAPFWRDNFEFTDLAAFNGITINVLQSKGRKVTFYGKAHIPIREDLSDDCDEGWYPIVQVDDRTRTTGHLGDLRLKLKYEEQFVLPLSNYNELLDIICDFRENNVISKLAARVTDLESFAKNVLRILEGRGMAVIWLISLIDEEVAEAVPEQVNNLFRANTLLTKALEAYMLLVGSEYLDDTLGDILRSICTQKTACEVDPCKLEKGEDVKSQWRILFQHTRTCWRAVIESVHRFPRELLLVFSHLQRRLIAKFPESPRLASGVVDQKEAELASQARYTGVSGFVFLRLICPAILTPKLFNIVREHPEARAHRTLTLIAKSLQGLANLVWFGKKELWMLPMNDFISENIQSLKDFVDQICSVSIPSELTSSSNSVRSLPLPPPPPPHSPGTANTSVFRSPQSKGGSGQTSSNLGGSNIASGGGYGAGATLGSSSSAGYGNGGYGGSRTHVAPPQLLQPPINMSGPLPSPGSQKRGSQSSGSSNGGGNSANATMTSLLMLAESSYMDRHQDLPLLPHLIDLGKELAYFSTTVARVVRPWHPHEAQDGFNAEEGERDEAEAGADERSRTRVADNAVEGNHSMEQTPQSSAGQMTGGSTLAPNYSSSSSSTNSSSSPSLSATTASGKGRKHEQEMNSGTGDHGDEVLRQVGRVCWDIIAIIKQRVERCAEKQNANTSLHQQHYYYEQHPPPHESPYQQHSELFHDGGEGPYLHLQQQQQMLAAQQQYQHPSLYHSDQLLQPHQPQPMNHRQPQYQQQRQYRVQEGARDEGAYAMAEAAAVPGSEEFYLIYEHYLGQDMEAEGYEGYVRSCDSDDDSLEHPSIQGMI